jgi:uncharacterized protein
MSNHVLDRIAKVEFTAGGLCLYGISFFMLLVPVAIFCLETLMRRWNPDSTLPIPPPTKISQIRVYPIKSCRGITLEKARLRCTGLDLDRHWMWVDPVDMKFLTIRQNSKMTLIETAITPDDELAVSAPSVDLAAHFKIPAHPSQDWLEKNTEIKTVTIWSTKTDAWVYPAELTARFSKVFGKEVRLVYKGPTPRLLIGNGAPKVLGRTESTMFPDLMPVLVANERSIQELNSRLVEKGEHSITIERFRPNIVVAGDDPWYEDIWKTIKLKGGGNGKATDIVMDVTQHCARCLVSSLYES